MSLPTRATRSPLPVPLLVSAILGSAWSLGIAAQEGVDLRPAGGSTYEDATPDRVASPGDGGPQRAADAEEATQGSPAPPEPSQFRASDDANDVVIEFRRLDRPLPEGGERPHRWRIYGDGRLEKWPEPKVTLDPPYRLTPEALAALLRSLVVLNDLPAHQSHQPPPDDRSYLRVHLDRYHSVDWATAIDYLDAVVVEDLDATFDSKSRTAFRASLRELAAVRQWLAWSHPGVVWISGNPLPPICSPGRRLDLGLADGETPWCAYFRSRQGASAFPEDDPIRREAIEERLRERLRALPRGLEGTGGSNG